MKMELTFLKKNQLYGKEKLDVFKGIGAKAAITDFAIIMGGYVSSDYYVQKTNKLEDRTGYYWTQTGDDEHNVYIVNEDGDYHLANPDFFPCGCRIALNLEEEWEDFFSLNNFNMEENEIEYGYYPQISVFKEMQQELEEALEKKTISQYQNIYTTPFDQSCVYGYKGKKYIRLELKSCDMVLLSNHEIYQKGDNIWIEVLPVKWLVDKSNLCLVSKKILYAGLIFSKDDYFGNFMNTEIQKFINKVLKRELFNTEFHLLKELVVEEKIMEAKKNRESSIKENIKQFDDFYQADWNTSFLLSNFGDQEFYFDFLSADQAKKLLCRKQGMMSTTVTPFAILQGAKYFQNDGDFFGYYWTKDFGTGFKNYPLSLVTVIVDALNEIGISKSDAVGIGGRPLLVFDDFCNFLRNSHLQINDDESSIYLGCFPQEIVSSEFQEILEYNYQNDELSFTGRNYRCLGFEGEYQYQNRRFVRTRLNVTSPSVKEFFSLYFPDRYLDHWAKTSNTNYYNMWIEVKPVKWIILNNRMLLCEKIIFSYPFSKNPFYHDYEESDIFRWVNDDLKKMLFQNSSLLEEDNIEENRDKNEELKKFKELLIESMEDLDFLKKLKKMIDSTNCDKEIVNKNVKLKKREKNLT